MQGTFYYTIHGRVEEHAVYKTNVWHEVSRYIGAIKCLKIIAEGSHEWVSKALEGATQLESLVIISDTNRVPINVPCARLRYVRSNVGVKLDTHNPYLYGYFAPSEPVLALFPNLVIGSMIGVALPADAVDVELHIPDRGIVRFNMPDTLNSLSLYKWGMDANAELSGGKNLENLLAEDIMALTFLDPMPRLKVIRLNCGFSDAIIPESVIELETCPGMKVDGAYPQCKRVEIDNERTIIGMEPKLSAFPAAESVTLYAAINMTELPPTVRHLRAMTIVEPTPEFTVPPAMEKIHLDYISHSVPRPDDVDEYVYIERNGNKWIMKDCCVICSAESEMIGMDSAQSTSSTNTTQNASSTQDTMTAQGISSIQSTRSTQSTDSSAMELDSVPLWNQLVELWRCKK